jgi:DedD protein
MRLPFFRPKPDAEPQRPAAPRAERGRGASAEAMPGDVELARRRARQRLVGALVLLLVGVVAFPVLFETQPRPLPVDIPIRVGEGPPSSGSTTPALRPLPVTSLPAEAVAEPLPSPPAASQAAAMAAPVPAPRLASAPVLAPVLAPDAAPARAPASAPATAALPARNEAARNEAARAAALLAGGRVASVPAAATEAGRYVVQVGAYTDARTLKEARAKVEKLGLQTYTQVIEGDAGKRTRVRLGPYATRAEAEAAAEKLKRAGLPANILAL